MKIYSEPIFSICTCGRCGAVFRPEVGDCIQACGDGRTYYVYCPACQKSCETYIESKAEKNASDNEK